MPTPSNDDTMETVGALASFLIDAPPAPDDRPAADLGDFLAAPPVPVDPTTAEPPLNDELGIAPSGVGRLMAADLGDAIIASLITGFDRDGAGDVSPTPSAAALDDDWFADPSALLPAAAPPVATGEGSGGASDWPDPWSSSSWSSPSAPSRFSTAESDAPPRGLSAFDAGFGIDDRSPDVSEAIERIEGRLSQAVARLEEAVAAFSASGPPPLGSRPRGFRGRIDA